MLIDISSMTNGSETSSQPTRNSRPRRALVLASIALIGGLASGAAVWAQSGGSSATLTQPPSTVAPGPSSLTTPHVAEPTTTTSRDPDEVSQTVETATDHGDAATADAQLCDGWIEHADLGGHHGPMTIHDATNGAGPTAQDCANARTFYDSVASNIAKYATVDAAKDAGYEARARATEAGGFRHYFMKGGVSAVLDVAMPEGLMFYTDPATGVATLVGAVFSERTDELPQPGGPLTTWHDHHDASMCSATDRNCGSRAPRMLHVWTFASAIDPFAMDLPHAVGRRGSRRSFNPNS